MLTRLLSASFVCMLPVANLAKITNENDEEVDNVFHLVDTQTVCTKSSIPKKKNSISTSIRSVAFICGVGLRTIHVFVCALFDAPV